MAEAVQIETIAKKMQEQTAEIRFPRRTLARIDALAKRTSRTRNFLINQAVEHSLEDLEDIYLKSLNFILFARFRNIRKHR